jgi:VIT1/CCC1 family predicted Fe2+/Mn2+ transporter
VGTKSSQRDQLHQMHTQEAIAHRITASTAHSYLGDFVLGAVDGAVTTFAIVAGAAGASLSSGVATVLGLANVLADGFSMAAGNFLKARADQQTLERFRRMEEMHIDRIPEGEREEIRQIFAGKGFDGKVLEEVVSVITQDRKQWVDTMLREEWGLQLDPPLPWRAALVTFAAFILAGLVPLLPVFVSLHTPAQQTFAASTVLTGVAFFVIGYIRGRVVEQRAWLSGLETVLIGGAAAALAYFVGVWLRQLAVG